MNCTLIRREFKEQGIFGELLDKSGKHVAYTLEHAYDWDGAVYCPKLPPGTYQCQRGAHRLHSMTHDFITYEVTGVPCHAGILFHVGNFNKDSEGCVLLGVSVENNALSRSTMAFDAFMRLQDGVDKFELVVQDEPQASA